MKSHDIVVLFKIESIYHRYGLKESTFDKNLIHETSNNYLSSESGSFERSFSVRALEQETGISKSQVNLSLQRMEKVGLLKESYRNGLPIVNTRSLLEFIAYGIRFVFPAELGKPARGIPTSSAAPVLRDRLLSSTDVVPVWPHHLGKENGFSVEPLHSQVSQAIESDDICYALLALTDAIRIGQARERGVAIKALEQLLGVQL